MATTAGGSAARQPCGGQARSSADPSVLVGSSILCGYQLKAVHVRPCMSFAVPGMHLNDQNIQTCRFAGLDPAPTILNTLGPCTHSPVCHVEPMAATGGSETGHLASTPYYAACVTRGIDGCEFRAAKSQSLPYGYRPVPPPMSRSIKSTTTVVPPSWPVESVVLGLDYVPDHVLGFLTAPPGTRRRSADSSQWDLFKGSFPAMPDPPPRLIPTPRLLYSASPLHHGCIEPSCNTTLSRGLSPGPQRLPALPHLSCFGTYTLVVSRLSICLENI